MDQCSFNTECISEGDFWLKSSQYIIYSYGYTQRTSAMSLNQNTSHLIPVDEICEFSINYLDSQCPCPSNVCTGEPRVINKS